MRGIATRPSAGPGRGRRRHRPALALTAAVATALLLLALAPSASAGPFHARKASLDIAGLNHACGAATDSKGDFYASSAGESKVKVYNPSHVLLTEISDANTPCGLAVTTTGVLYVSEQATGEVVSFKPNKYPFEGTPTYGSREAIDASAKAKGIAVDPFDDALYVAEGDRVSAYVHELQTVSLENIVTGGTFQLKFEGQETTSLPYNATAAAVQAALEAEALPAIGAGNVEVVKRSSLSWAVFFTGKFAYTDVPEMVPSYSLTGTNPRVGVRETAKGFSGHIGEGTLSEASGVAAFSYHSGEGSAARTDRYLWVADANGLAADRLDLFGGTNVGPLSLRRELDGATTPDGSFGFGAAGAYLAADPGNRGTKGECVVVGEPQACTAGHLFLYDAAHKALDEFDATGGYLDQTKNAAFADAEPTAIAIDRSGGANDGTLYVTAGAGAGAKALAFGPLKAPSRETLKKASEGGLSQELEGVRGVATDSHGDVYASAGAHIHIYGPSGAEITAIEDPGKPRNIAVDSACNVYVLDENGGFSSEYELTYYTHTPSKCPPDNKTTYTRHEETIETTEGCPTKNKNLKTIAVNPGPGPGKDSLFALCGSVIRLFDSAANGSALLNAEFAKGLTTGARQSIAVNGAKGIVYIGTNPKLIFGLGLDETGTDAKEVLVRFEATGSSNGKVGANPYVAVDQANGHVLEYDGTYGAREYDAAGGFVAEFGAFTEDLSLPYQVAVDGACATHEPPLDETTTPTCHEYDPANGTAYVAYDDTNPKHPPYDVSAFGPLDYGPTPPTPEYELTVKKEGTGSGKVTSPPAGIDCGSTCTAKFEEDTEVTLSQSKDLGSKFVKWGGACSGSGECKVSMSEAREVTAEFESTETLIFPLKVVIEGPGSGNVTSSPEGIECTPTCEAPFFKNTNVTLTAAEGESSKFASWTGCDANPSATQCEVSITGPREVKVKFNVETPLLTVVKKGAGAGTVTGGSLAEPNTINCGTGSGCEHEFELGAEVTLKAKAEAGSTFNGWEVVGSPGACSGKELTCLVTMSKAKEVKATFDALPQAKAKQANPVLYDEATLRGEVDPSGLPTEYRFEYLTEEEYEDNGETFDGAQPTPIEELAPGEAFVAVEAPIFGLEEGTEYRFRLRAMNSVGPAEGEGAFETLQRRAPESCLNTAYRFGLSAALPDCRAYELVTPAQTDGLTPSAPGDYASNSDIKSFSNWLTLQRGEGAGERLSYFTEGTLPGFEGNGVLDGYRAERGAGDHPAGGWQSAPFSPDYAESAPEFGHIALPFGVASDQLYSFWEISPAPETFPQTRPQGVYLRTPAGFEALGRGSLGTDLGALSRYVSAGGTHAIFSSMAHLEEDAPPEGNVALYDRAAGSASAHVLTLPPSDASEEEQAEFFAALRSKEQASFSGASEDGATVVFKAGVALYVRLDDASTERVSPNTAQVGDPLACAAGPLFEGQQRLTARRMGWLRNGTPTGPIGNDISIPINYSAQPSDEGAALQCRTVATDNKPRSVAISAPIEIAPLTPAQVPHPPAQIPAPIPATPTVGTVETCNAGSWKGAESLAYQWYVDGEAIAGATAQTYEVQAADVPGTLQCVVKGSNAAATVARASGLRSTSPAPAEAAPIATAQAAVVATYAGASEDGRYIFFALGDGKSPARLFRFDTQSESATEIAAAGIFAAVSPDGTHAFFSSTEALSGGEENDNGEEAEAGAHNLYAWDGTGASFIGRLSAGDFEHDTFVGIDGMDLAAWTEAIGPGLRSGRAKAPTRSTPDGGAFAFQSHARLSAYDNEGVGEIYRYEPAAEAGERLLCVSCDPSGAPPSADALLEDIRNGIPNPINALTMIANLTDGGEEVFFQSFDRLLPEDANEAEDVYEWQAKGTGGCTRPGGCLALVSSGQGETPSFLYAMSAGGRDVFFATKEKLVGVDVAGSPSVYDARVGGGIPEPAAPAPCQGDACQGSGSEPPALPSPASTGAGEGNEGQPARPSCAKGRHRVKGRCVKRHPKKHHVRHERNKGKKHHHRAKQHRRAHR